MKYNILIILFLSLAIFSCKKDDDDDDDKSNLTAEIVDFGETGDGIYNLDLYIYDENTDGELYLEIYTSTDGELASGTYSFSDSYNALTFSSFSDYYLYDSETSINIESGSFIVVNNGNGNYTVTTSIVLSNEEEIELTYKGKPDYYDETDFDLDFSSRNSDRVTRKIKNRN